MKHATALTLAVTLVGCGGGEDRTCTGTGDPDELRGSFCENNEIAWDTVELGWFAGAGQVRIRYGIAEEDRVAPRFQISVVGMPSTGLRLEPNVSIPVALPVVVVQRWPDGAERSQSLNETLETMSSIIFETLDLRVGGMVVGEFALSFTTGRSLRGRFGGTLIDLTPQGG